MNEKEVSELFEKARQSIAAAHKAVISAFGKEFIKTGIFPADYHRYLLDAFDLRNLGDYGTIHSVNKDQVQQLIQHAKDIVDAIQLYLAKSP